MIMKKVNLIIKGNLLLSTGGGNIYCGVDNLNDYDITSAIIIEGDITCDSITANSLTLVTGNIIFIDKEGGYDANE